MIGLSTGKLYPHDFVIQRLKVCNVAARGGGAQGAGRPRVAPAVTRRGLPGPQPAAAAKAGWFGGTFHKYTGRNGQRLHTDSPSLVANARAPPGHWQPLAARRHRLNP